MAVATFRGPDRCGDHVSRQAIAADDWELAAGDWTKPVAGQQVIGCWMNPKPGDLLPTHSEDFAGAGFV